MASNLVPGDTAGSVDVFLRDRENATTTRIGPGLLLDISADGRFVVLHNLGSTGLWDAASGTTERIGPGGFGAVSAEGRYVVYSHDTGLYSSLSE